MHCVKKKTELQTEKKALKNNQHNNSIFPFSEPNSKRRFSGNNAIDETVPLTLSD